LTLDTLEGGDEMETPYPDPKLNIKS
jgi:hypothetical protein